MESIRARRQRLRPGTAPPIVIWEPVPDLCTPEELENLQEAARFVDVISPNRSELIQFFAELGSVTPEHMVDSMLAKAKDSTEKPGVVVRDGADGSRLYLGGKALHLRAYHQNGMKVVDPTGGGNTYLGALAIGLSGAGTPDESWLDEKIFSECKQKPIRTPRLRRYLLAVIHATMAASYAIEQVGMPSLVGDREDHWNGEVYQHRFAEYIAREKSHILKQIDEEADSLDLSSAAP